MQISFGPIFHPASPQVEAISGLFVTVLAICAVILAIVTGLVAYCVLRCRAKDGAPEPKQVFGSKNLEITWTAIPCFTINCYLINEHPIDHNGEVHRSRGTFSCASN